MKTTIDMARDALIVPFLLKATNDEHIVRLKDFEALVRADDREACAVLCDQLSDSSRDLRFGAAIRARGQA
jgi:HEAT repeat protein